MAQKSLLTDTPKKLLQKYYRILLKQGIGVEKLILFGSHAQKLANKHTFRVCYPPEKLPKNHYA